MDLLQTIINGILLGGLYGLIGLAVSLNFGVMRIVNLSIGDLVIMAAYLSFFLMEGGFSSPFSTLWVVIPLLFGVGFLLQRYIIDKTLGKGVLPPLLVTFGISIILQNTHLLAFSADPRTLATPVATESITLAELGISKIYAIDLGGAILVLGAVVLFLKKTNIGIQLRAVADDDSTARLMGINPKKVYAIAGGLSMVFAAVAGVLYGTTFTFEPSTGSASLLIAFEAVVIGGLGSLWGTLIGGMVLGLGQLLGAALIGPSYGLIAGHIIFLIILIFRPRGIMAR